MKALFCSGCVSALLLSGCVAYPVYVSPPIRGSVVVPPQQYYGSVKVLPPNVTVPPHLEPSQQKPPGQLDIPLPPG